MKHIGILVVCLSVAGCAPSTVPFKLQSGLFSGEDRVKDAEIVENNSQALAVDSEFKRLIALPEFEAQLAKYLAVEERYQSVKAAQGFTVSASGDLGAQSTQGSEGVLSVGLVGQKSLNLQSENDLVLSNIENEKKLISLDIQYSIDKIVAQEMLLSVAREHLEEIRTVTAKYRRLYQENKPALQAAITAGIVSSSEEFKFRKILSSYDRRLHEAETSYALLELQSDRYSGVLNEDITALSNKTPENLLDRAMSENDLIEVEKLNLQLAILENEMSLLDAQKKLQGTFVSRLASPVTEDDDITAFVGVNLTLPIFDGGAKDLQRTEKERLSDGIRSSIDAYIEKNNDAKKQLQKMNADATTSISMLVEEQALSNEIIADLETRLTYGGASISDLVSEMLSLADLEIQLIEKRRQLKQNILDYTSNYGISCSLTNSCNSLAWSAVFDEN